MNRSRSGGRTSNRGWAMSRRLALGAGVALAAGSVVAATAPAARRGSGCGGYLHGIVAGKTVDVHAHVTSPTWWANTVEDGRSAPGRGSGSALGGTDYFRRAAIARREAFAALSAEERQAVEDWQRRRGAAGSLGEAVAVLLAEYDLAGIDCFVNLTIDNLPLPGPAGERYSAGFETVLAENAAARKLFPGRMITFAGVDPRRGPDAVRMFESAVRDYGCAGYGELVGTLWRVEPDDRELVYPLMEKAIELEVPFLCDATMPFGFATPDIFRRITSDFPELTLVLGGAGAGVAPEQRVGGAENPAHWALLELAETRDNVWLDLGDWQSIGFEHGSGILTDDNVAELLRYLRRALDGPARGRVMFGSDHPIYNDVTTQRGWIRRVVEHPLAEELGFRTEDWERFFSRNALDLLGLT